jgi:hypothetical protein
MAFSIYIDNNIIEEFRHRADESGRGYPAMMNEALREYLGKSLRPVDETTLRRILSEELKTVGALRSVNRPHASSPSSDMNWCSLTITIL